MRNSVRAGGRLRGWILASVTACVFVLAVPAVAWASGQSQTSSTAQKGSITLRYAFWGDRNEHAITQQMMKRFEQANPGIKVELVYIPTNYLAKMDTMAASNTLPDIGYMHPPDVLPWAMEGKIMDIGKLLESFPAMLKQSEYTTPDGRVVAVSFADEVQVLWYNKALFKKAGVPYPPTKASDAWTWQQFVNVAKKLTLDSNGKTPNDPGFNPNSIVQYGVNIPHSYITTLAFVYSNGGGVVDPKNHLKLTFGEPATIEAIQKLADLVNVDHVSPIPAAQKALPSVSTALLTGKVAMEVDGQWDLLTLGKTKGLDYGIGVLPKMKYAVTDNVGAAMAIFSTTKYKKQVETLWKYVMDPVQVLPQLQNGLWQPTERQWYTNPTLVKKWIDNPVHPTGFKTAVVDYTLNNDRQTPGFFLPDFTELTNIFSPALDQVWLGKDSAQNVITNQVMPKMTAQLARDSKSWNMSTAK